MFTKTFHHLRSRNRLGFTLIELLIVVAIIAVVVSISTMAIGGTLQGLQLTSAGQKVTRLIDAARQRAMAGNVQTALLLVTNMPERSDEDNIGGRAFCLMERGSGGTWVQIREWEVIPDGIIVDLQATGVEGSFLANTESTSSLPGSGELPSLLGTKNYQVAYRVFLPSGGLARADLPARLQLVNGRITSGALQYMKANSSAGPINYYRITIIGATGKSIVDRP